jgi:hypothetical protein
MMQKAAVMSSANKSKATRKDIEREASRYILHELGDRLWAGDPVYDKTRRLWSVPVHSLSLPQDVELGQITVDAHGAVVKAPTRSVIKRMFLVARNLKAKAPLRHALRPEFKKRREKPPSTKRVKDAASD